MAISILELRVIRCLNCNSIQLLASDTAAAEEARNCGICPQVFGDLGYMREQIGVLTYRPESLRQQTFPFTVAPTDVLYSGWIDFAAPSLLSLTQNVQGLDDPDTGVEFVAVTVYELPGYHDAAEPAVTPDGGSADGCLSIGAQGAGTVLSGTEYELRFAPRVVARWCYLQVSAGGSNTHTATVAVTLTI